MARYINGSAAEDLAQEEFAYEEAAYEAAQPQRAPESPRRLTVIPGSKPQHAAQTQTQLSPLAVTLCKCAVAFLAVLVVAALGRILLISAAFGYAAQNTTIQNELEEARSLGSELEVQQSVYGSASRVVSLATEVYGMVTVEDVAVLDISTVSADAAATVAAPATVAADSAVDEAALAETDVDAQEADFSEADGGATFTE